MLACSHSKERRFHETHLEDLAYCLHVRERASNPHTDWLCAVLVRASAEQQHLLRQDEGGDGDGGDDGGGAGGPSSGC